MTEEPKSPWADEIYARIEQHQRERLKRERVWVFLILNLLVAAGAAAFVLSRFTGAVQ